MIRKMNVLTSSAGGGRQGCGTSCADRGHGCRHARLPHALTRVLVIMCTIAYL